MDRQCFCLVLMMIFLGQGGCTTDTASLTLTEWQKNEVLADGRSLVEALRPEILPLAGDEGAHPLCKEALIGQWRGVLKNHIYKYSRKRFGERFSKTGACTSEVEFSIALRSDGRCEQRTRLVGSECVMIKPIMGSWSYVNGVLMMEWATGYASRYSVFKLEGTKQLGFLLWRKNEGALIGQTCDRSGRVCFSSRNGCDLEILLSPPMVMTCIDSLDRSRFEGEIMASERRVELDRLRDAGVIDEDEYVKEVSALKEGK